MKQEYQADIPDYELLRRIGHGSYGDVWLARTKTGSFRAVKVIHRRAFEADRPYEREFAGIKEFEPISRSHASQVDLLHVGRNDEAGYFYYVMELADDASAAGLIEGAPGATESMVGAETGSSRTASSRTRPILPESYAPRTLKAVIEGRRRLTASECVNLGVALAEALEHLHGHGLVHRDIKPSNIIFVNGRPKLADIGLVARADATMSFVGTEGYLPPEGPGKPQADIYSLGKVLFEASTGKNRREFPALPTRIESPENEDYVELNEIILKACEAHPGDRYQTASELLEDLALLRKGGSVRAARRSERRFKTAKRLGLVCAGLALLAIGGWQMEQLRRPAFPVPKVRPLNLDRTDFLEGELFRLPRHFDFSPDGNRIVMTRRRGSPDLRVWDRATSTTRPVNVKNSKPWRLHFPRWSPDGKRIMVIAHRMDGPQGHLSSDRYAFLMVDPYNGELQQVSGELGAEDRPRDFCWRPDGSGLTYVDDSRKMYTLMLNGGGRALWADWQAPENVMIFRLGEYSPDGEWLSFSVSPPGADVSEAQNVWIVRHMGGRAEPITDNPGMDVFPVWGPEGKSLYYVSSSTESGSSNIRKVRIDPASGAALGKPEPVTQDYSKRYFFPKFLTGSKPRLAYVAIVPNTRIWIESNGERSQVAQGVNPQISHDGQRAYYVGELDDQRGIWRVDRDGRNPRQITRTVPDHQRFTLSPDETTIAYTAYEKEEFGVYTVPTAGADPVLRCKLEVQARDVLPVWSPDSQWLAYADGSTVYVMRQDGSERKALAHLWRWEAWTFKWSPRGTHLAALGYPTPEEFKEDKGLSAFWISFPEATQGRLTPIDEPNYKEGLEWHPDGDRLTYMYYGPDDYGAQLRWAYLDGHTELWFDQRDHWDYVGTWTPGGEKFYFLSFTEGDDCRGIHIHDTVTGRIEHGLDIEFPQWSGDGETMLWVEGKPRRFLEIMEDFR